MNDLMSRVWPENSEGYCRTCGQPLAISGICYSCAVEALDAAEVNKFRETLADLCHEQWSGWMQYLFCKGVFNEDGTWTMHKEYAERWQRQMNTPYDELSEAEQDSDRKEADKFLRVMGRG